MNIFQKGSGGNVPNGTNPDPVTCTQLTDLFNQLITKLGRFEVPNPPTTPPPPPPPPVDLTAIDADLKAIAAKLDDPNSCICAWTKRDISDLDAGNALVKAAVQYWDSLGLGDPAISQIVLS